MQDFALYDYDHDQDKEAREERNHARQQAWVHIARKCYARHQLTDADLCQALRVDRLEAFNWSNPHAFEIADMRLSNYLGWEEPIHH